MNEWAYELTPKAKKDFAQLDGSQRKAVLKALRRLIINPRSAQDGGYGFPLGNKGDLELAGLLKIKLRGSGIRIVYDLIEEDGKAYVIVIGLRKDEEVYREAAKRLPDYMFWRDEEE